MVEKKLSNPLLTIENGRVRYHMFDRVYDCCRGFDASAATLAHRRSYDDEERQEILAGGKVVHPSEPPLYKFTFYHVPVLTDWCWL